MSEIPAPPFLARTESLLGPLALERLAAARVAVFGLGGVGGHAAEALARSGVGAIDLVDHDTVCESNINRQAVALRSTIGLAKTRVMTARIRDINPGCAVTAYDCFFDVDTQDQFDFNKYDYVLDAIDTVKSKLLLAEICAAQGISLVSCMGTGNKLDPSKLAFADIYETSVCPLARVMRQELRRRGVAALKVVYSTEPPLVNRRPPGSVAFVPPVAGLMMAGAAVNDLAVFSSLSQERQPGRAHRDGQQQQPQGR